MVDTTPTPTASTKPPGSLSAAWANLSGNVELRVVRRKLERPSEPDTLTLRAPARIIQGIGELVDELAENSLPPTTSKSPFAPSPLQARGVSYTRTEILMDSDGDGILDFVTNKINLTEALSSTSKSSQLAPEPTPSSQHTISTLTVSSIPMSDSISTNPPQTTPITVTVISSTYFSTPTTTETPNPSPVTPGTINRTTAIAGGVVLVALIMVGVIFMCYKYCVKNKFRFVWDAGRKKKPGGKKPLIGRDIAREGNNDKEKGELNGNMSPRPSIQLVRELPSNTYHEMEMDRVRSIDSQYPRVVCMNSTNSLGLQNNPWSAASLGVGEPRNRLSPTSSPVYCITPKGNTGAERSSELTLATPLLSRVNRTRQVTVGTSPHSERGVGTLQSSITGGNVSMDNIGSLRRTISPPRIIETTTIRRSQLGCASFVSSGELDGSAVLSEFEEFDGDVIMSSACGNQLPQSLEQRTSFRVGQNEDPSTPVEVELMSDTAGNYSESSSVISVPCSTGDARQNFSNHHQFEQNTLRGTSQAVPRPVRPVSHAQIYSTQIISGARNDIIDCPLYRPSSYPPDTTPRTVRICRSISPQPSIHPGPERCPASVILTLIPGHSTPSTMNIVLDDAGDSNLSVRDRSSWTINPPQSQSSHSGSAPLTERQGEIRANAFTSTQIHAVQRSSPLESLIRTHTPYPEHDDPLNYCDGEGLEWGGNHRAQAVSAWIQAAPSVWDDPDFVSVADAKTEYTRDDNGESIAEGYEGRSSVPI